MAQIVKFLVLYSVMATFLIGPVALVYPDRFGRAMARWGLQTPVAWAAKPAPNTTKKTQLAIVLELYNLKNMDEIGQDISALYRRRAEAADRIMGL